MRVDMRAAAEFGRSLALGGSEDVDVEVKAVLDDFVVPALV